VASINDVFDALNDIKGKLDTIHGDETTVANRVSTTNTRLTTLNSSINDVGDRLEARLVEIRGEQQQANALLLHETEQLSTVICALDAIADGVCALVNIATTDALTLRAIAESGRVAADIARSVNPAASLDLDRRDAAAAALAACCPPEPLKPACEHVPCPDPGPFRGKVKEPEPIG
jgi:hypothetical protein